MFDVAARDGAVVVRMDDGKVNAMGPAFVDAFRATWRKATEGGAPVVLAGNARAFSAGLDLKTLPALAPDALADFAGAFMAMFRDVLAYRRPVVAAVDGPALAGGAVLALASDFRFATPNARLGLTEVPVGVPFPRAVVDLARLRLPVQEHGEAILRGTVREGADAVARGWGDRLVEREALVDEAARLAADLGRLPAPAYASAKGALVADALASFDAFDGRAWAARFEEPAVKEAIAATMARLAKR